MGAPLGVGVAVIGGCMVAALMMALVAWRFPDQTEDGKDAMRVDGERIWK